MCDQCIYVVKLQLHNCMGTLHGSIVQATVIPKPFTGSNGPIHRGGLLHKSTSLMV